MFTQPVPSPTGPSAAASTVSPSRSSRLRGLSYIRNYTHNHLLSRDASNSGAPNSTPATPPRTGGLTRSVSYTPGTLGPSTPNTSASNRLSLVSTTPDGRIRQQFPEFCVSPDLVSESTESQQQQQPEASAAAVCQDASNTAMRTADGSGPASGPGPDAAPLSIRFSAYFDPRATRPSLSFSPITRTLPNGTETIRVGRYSERENQPPNVTSNLPSAVPVGFKSKVVSRHHCEFWCENGKWYIKDVKSSSGTFLNHIRLSPPSQESKAFAVNDGDIVQLGIDFKGGEEMIFRCVKMRLELNRNWQHKPNSFNVAAVKRLRTMGAKNKAVAGAGNSSQDCSICLNSIAPCQSLFVAPCSHTWHFKCVKSLLMSPQYPIYICPNCRASVDLEADVEEPEEWETYDESQKEEKLDPIVETAAAPEAEVADADRMDISSNEASETQEQEGATEHATSEPLPIRHGGLRRGTPPLARPGAEGPITPRNDIGPWVLDGRAGRESPDGPEMTSLDAAATEMDLTIHADEDPSP